MAKQPPLPDRFRITCETSENEMGVLIAQLTRMGFSNISFELITDIPTFKRNAPGGHEQSATDLVLAWIADNPTFNARDLSRLFKEAGRNSGGAYYVLNKLVDAGTIIDLGNRNYQRADVKAIEAPTAADKTEGAPRKFATRGEDEILKFARKHGGKFNTSQIVALFEQQGRARNSVYASANALMANKMIKRVGESGSGDYVLLAKGRSPNIKMHKAKKTKPAPKADPTPAPQLNGSTQHPQTNTEVAVHV